MQCEECGLHLVIGMYIYQAGKRRFCQGCVKLVFLANVPATSTNAVHVEQPGKPIGNNQFFTELSERAKRFAADRRERLTTELRNVGVPAREVARIVGPDGQS